MERLGKALKKAEEAREASRPSEVAADRVAERPAIVPKSAPSPRRQSTEDLTDHRIVAALYNDPHSDLFRHLRAQVFQYLSRVKGRSVGVCSSTSGEGKTLVAVNLAVSISLDVKYRVVLIDLDLRRPSVHTHLGIESSPGLIDWLGGETNLEDCIVDSGIDRLSVIPAGRAVKNSSEILGSPRMGEFFGHMKSLETEFICVYDLPPLLASDDAIGILPQVDSVLFVVREGKTTPGEIQRSMHLLDGYNLVGSVLNKSESGNPYPYY